MHCLNTNIQRRVQRLLLCSVVLSLLLVATATAVYAQSKLPFSVPSDIKSLPETALVETSKGSFEIRFFRELAPVTVTNFVHLAKTQFYNDLIFHRYVEDYVVQGGDPEGVGKFGGPGYTLPPEFSKQQHLRGTVGMARLPNARNPDRNSNGSQFYITLRRSPQLDGLYTVFAEVVRGMEVVEQLRQGDAILRVRLPKPEKE
jgi:peptidyl-prolyl cis-trans isomerase B (cyclophilin B)